MRKKKKHDYQIIAEFVGWKLEYNNGRFQLISPSGMLCTSTPKTWYGNFYQTRADIIKHNLEPYGYWGKWKEYNQLWQIFDKIESLNSNHYIKFDSITKKYTVYISNYSSKIFVECSGKKRQDVMYRVALKFIKKYQDENN